MESFKYNVYESKSLFSEFYHSRHGFFTRVPHFNALPGMFLTLYSSIIIIQLKRRFVACAWSVASDFLGMLNGKWSSQKFQDEQINEKFGVAFSDGDICIFCYNINVGSIPSQPY